MAFTACAWGTSLERDRVFFSYRHEDERWLAAVRAVLEPYVLAEGVLAWSDKDIRTGERWHDKIQDAIARTRVAVVLVSQQFFGSEYITRLELPALLADADAGLLTLVCVPVGPCDPELLVRHGLSKLQFGLDPEEPLGARRGDRRQRALVEVATKIHRAYGQVAAIPAAPRIAPRRGEVVAASDAMAPQPPGALLDVPPLDLGRHVPRTDDMDAIRRALLFGTEVAQGVTSAATGFGLHGMGGMGKTVLAQALCHDAEVRAAFPGGIAWVAVGQRPDLLAMQSRLLAFFEPGGPAPDTIDDGRERLRKALDARRALLVVDDVWDAGHYRRAFDVARGRSRVLVTTRDASVLTAIGARSYPLQALPPPLALELLGRWSGKEGSELPCAASTIVELCRSLPLAVALAGAQIADGLGWETLEEQLRQGRIDFLDHPYGSIYQSLGRSVDALVPEDRERYLELAAFPEDVPIDVGVVARLWKHTGRLDAAGAEKLLVRLDRKALLTLSGEGPRLVRLHDLQQDFLRLRCEDEEALHGRLIDACRAANALPAGASGWARMPQGEPYLWRWLAHHLCAAGRAEELESALVDLDFIRARLEAETSRGAGKVFCSVGALRTDYERVSPGSPARLVWRCLRRSAHVLGPHPEALEQQLFGRLRTAGSAPARSLAAAALAVLERRDALVPARGALQPPGAQDVTLAGHSEQVHGALLMPDGRRALSWSADGTLRLWDLEGVSEPRVLSGHSDQVYGALLMLDGRRALSWSQDGTLRLWDLEGEGEPRVLSGHSAPVYGALLAPDGRRAFSWSADSTPRLWDLEGESEPRVLSGHSTWVDGALLMLDGRRALTWSDDGTLRLWDLEGEREPRVLSGHSDQVYGALLTPNGRRALSWSGDRTLRLWDLDAESEQRVFSGHSAPVYGALLMLDGRRALSWSKDGTLRLWDLEGESEPRVFSGHSDEVYGALLMLDGRRALSWSKDGTLRLWDLEGESEPRVLSGHSTWVDGALLMPDGRHALSWSGDRTLRLWDLEGESELHVLSGHAHWVKGALLIPDGRRALSWSGDRTLRLWDLDGESELHVLSGHADWVNGALHMPDGRRALSWSADGSLRLWGLEGEGEPCVLSGHLEGIGGALLMPDGRRALSWSRDGTLRLWDLDGESEPRVLKGHSDWITGAVLMPDGRRALSWSVDGTLRLWDLEGESEPRVLSGHLEGIRGALLMPDGRRALSWSGDRTLRLWDLEGESEPRVLSGHLTLVDGALLMPDGRRALSWSRDGTLRLWNLEGESEPRVLGRHSTRIDGALLMPDGRRALSWSLDGALRVWDLERESEPRVLSGHLEGIKGALLMPDGRRALSWSLDRTLRLWDLEGESEPRVLSGHAGSVDGAQLMPDGRRALSWSGDSTLRLWDLDSRRQRGCYFADAGVTTAEIDRSGTRVLVGDAGGAVHVLRIDSR